MRTLLVLLSALLLAEAKPSSNGIIRPGFPEADLGRDSRILYGEDAAEGEYPHQLSLMVSTGNYHTCGAVLIAADTALTAAHCVNENNPGNYYVRAGQRVQGQPESEHDVSSIESHEDYSDGGNYPNDISILHLASSANLGNPNIGAINIARAADGDFAGEACEISGWGTTESGPSPSILQRADTEVVSNAECNNLLIGCIGCSVDDVHICVYTGHNGACSGDSGGPLTCSNGNRVAGITSWVVFSGGECTESYPSVYTRVSEFEDWIDARVPGLP